LRIEDVISFLLIVILFFAGYWILRLALIILRRIIKFGSPRPGINIVSLIAVPITGFAVSFAAAVFLVCSVWLLIARVFNLVRSPRDEFYLAIVVVLSTLASFIIAFIAGGVIADTNRKFKTVQAFIVGTAIVGLWWLFGYITGHDYAADPTWFRYVGYVNDTGIVLAAVVGRYLLSDFAWEIL
jgi:hypothetical protein